jgi:phage major head subunit gpT-like protein
LWEDDQYNIMNKKPAQLARAVRMTVEDRAARLIRRGFTDATGGDSEELFSTSHDREDGGTAQSNASATGVTLTEANLETAQLAVRQVKDGRGNLIMVKADTLLVPPELEKEARIITDSTLRSATGDNDLNVYRGVFKIVVWDYLGAAASGGSATAWYLLDSGVHQLNFFWRVRPEFKQDTSFDTDMAMYKVRCRFSNGHSDWRGIWGSKGDGAAYSG